MTELRKRWTSEQGHIDSPTSLHEFETGQLDRLIEYLQVVDTSHSDSFETSKLHNDFKKFYQQYDIRRNKNFAKTFPNLRNGMSPFKTDKYYQTYDYNSRRPVFVELETLREDQQKRLMESKTFCMIPGHIYMDFQQERLILVV